MFGMMQVQTNPVHRCIQTGEFSNHLKKVYLQWRNFSFLRLRDIHLTVTEAEFNL